MNNIPIDIISVCIMFFLDEKSIVRFSMTNKKINSCFLEGKWSIETCIKLIVHVDDILIDKIEKILLPIEFRCEKIDFWPMNICDILKKKKRDKLLKWIEKSTCMFFLKTYSFRSYNFRSYIDDDYDNLYIYDYPYDDNDTNENSSESEDEYLNSYFIRECKKKNKQIDYYGIYKNEIDCDYEINNHNENDDYNDNYEENENDLNNNLKNTDGEKFFIKKPTIWDFLQVNMLKIKKSMNSSN